MKFKTKKVYLKLGIFCTIFAFCLIILNTSESHGTLKLFRHTSLLKSPQHVETPSGGTDKVKIMNDIYQVGFQQVSESNDTFVYSALYDDEGKPFVRVIALAHDPLPSHNFKCVLWNSVNNFTSVQGIFTFIIEPPWKYPFRSGFISCTLPSGYRPLDISILPQNRNTSLNKLHVRYPSAGKNNLTRCFPAFHSGFSDVFTLVGMIEISRLLGTDKFVFYNNSINSNISRVLLGYKQKGLVEIRRWNMPISYRKIHYWGQMASMHDCVFSQINEAKYVFVADIDELIIPRHYNNWIDLANDFFVQTNKKKFGALVFQNAFFPLFGPDTKVDFPGKADAKKFSITPLFKTIRTKLHPPYERSKLIVNPKAVEILWIHGVTTFKEGFQHKVVQPEVALLHHYRKIPAPDMRQPWETDTSIHRFAAQIVSAVKKRMTSFGLES